MKSKLTTQTKWILLLLVFVLINAAVWMYGLAPALRRVDAAQAELDQCIEQKKQVQQKLNFLEGIDAKDLQETMEMIAPRLPQQGELLEFINGIVQIADSLGMSIPVVTISSPADVEPYLSVTLSAAVEGDYKQLKSFLVALEEHQRLILVRSYSISDSGDTLACSFSFCIFAEDFNNLTPFEASGRDNPFAEK